MMKATLYFSLLQTPQENIAFYLGKGFKIMATDTAPNVVQYAQNHFDDAVRNGQLSFMHFKEDDSNA